MKEITLLPVSWLYLTSCIAATPEMGAEPVYEAYPIGWVRKTDSGTFIKV